MREGAWGGLGGCVKAYVKVGVRSAAEAETEKPANGLIGVSILKKSELLVSTRRQVGASLSNENNTFFEN